MIGCAYFAGVFISASNMDREIAPSQLLVVLVGGLGGLLGSLLDSLLGARYIIYCYVHCTIY